MKKNKKKYPLHIGGIQMLYSDKKEKSSHLIQTVLFLFFILVIATILSMLNYRELAPTHKQSPTQEIVGGELYEVDNTNLLVQ